MSNHNNINFYKAKFMLEKSDDNNTDLLWEIILGIYKWLTRKWNINEQIIDTDLRNWTKIKQGGKLYSYDGTNERPVYIESEQFIPQDNTEQIFWACMISEKIQKSNCCERDWVTEIGFCQETPEKAEVCVITSYSDMAGFIGQYQDTPFPTLPNFVKKWLCNDKIHCFCGIDTISVQAIELKDGDFEKGFYPRLTHSERKLPYIYVSPRRKNSESEEIEWLINPNELAKAVCGNAIVYYSKSLGFDEEMKFYLNCKRYRCYDGSVRVYNPGFIDEESLGNKHPTLHPDFLEEIGENEALLIYRKALAQNINYYDVYFGIDACRKKQEEAKHQTQIEEIENTKLNDAQKIEDQIVELNKALTEEKKETANLKTKIDAMTPAYEQYKSLKKATTARFEICELPKTVEDIVGYFSISFADRIEFSENAKKSIKRCKIPLKDLWEVFYHLAYDMFDIYKDGSCPEPYKEFNHRTNLDARRGEGKMTRQNNDLMNQFTILHNGCNYDIQPHITFEKIGQSIHFAHDDSTGKIIIGHCGEHLNIHSTKNRK